MSENNVNKLLEELRDELARTEAKDEKGQELLQSLNADIQNLLERTDDMETDDSLIERLQDSIDHFETTHPTLTVTLSQMLNALNNAGI